MLLFDFSHLTSPLLALFVKSVLAAEFAKLLKLNSVGVIFLVLDSVVIPLLAFAANQSNLNSHLFGTSIINVTSLLRYLPGEIKTGSRTHFFA